MKTKCYTKGKEIPNILSSFFGESPRVKVINFFIREREFDYTLSSIAVGASINRITAREIIDNLLETKIILETRKMGKSQLYKINLELPKIKLLISFYDSIIVEKNQEAKRQ